MILIAGADHFFEGRLRELRDAIERGFEKLQCPRTVLHCEGGHPRDSQRDTGAALASYNPSHMPSSATDREKLALDMRVTARHLFEHALVEASIDRAFQRHVDCDRGVLRICEDLYDLDSYNRVLVISIGKAAHAMVNSLEMQAGNRFEGIVASSVDPTSQAARLSLFSRRPSHCRTRNPFAPPRPC